MPKYAVTVHFRGSTVITVEADDPEQAEDKAAELWEGGEEGEPDTAAWDWERSTVTVADTDARVSGLTSTEIEQLRQAQERYAAAQAKR